MTASVYLEGRQAPFEVADGETVLQAGLRQGLTLPYGCQSGTCASCRARLLDGRVRYPFDPPGLSAAERESGYVLLCLAQADGDLRLQLHQPPNLDDLRPQQWPCRVQERRWRNDDVLELRLKLPRRAPEAPGFRYLPGQYIDLLLDDGRRRSFSIANAPATGPDGPFLQLQIRVTPDGWFGQWAAHTMPERAILRFEGPLGAFYWREDSTRPALMVAGGTGVAPLRAMLEALTAGRDAGTPLPQAVHLYWGGRTRQDLYLHDELSAWAARHPNLHYTPVLSEGDAADGFAHGWVHEAPLRMLADLSGFEVYLSGPPVMVRAAKQAYAAAGVHPDRMHYDAFDDAHLTWPSRP